MNARSLIMSALCMATCVAFVAHAEDSYPNRAIRVLVAFPAGGSADIVGRLLTKKITEMTGDNFVVENRPGAGGNLAFAAAATAPPDGYTLIFSTPGIAINPHLYRKVEYKITDFKAIALIGEAPLALMVRPDLPINTVDELIKASAAAPDAIRFASSGNGSSSHLAADVLKSMTELQYLHVPYKGGAAAMVDMLGGRVDMTVLPISESLPYIRDGRLRALGQTGSKRSPIAPDIPTIEEGGVKGYSSTTWYMLLGPSKLPPAITAALAQKVDAALRSPDLQKQLEAAGVSLINTGPDKANEFLVSESARWAKAIERSGTRID